MYIGKTEAEAEAQYFGHLMGRANLLEKAPMLGKIENKRRGQQRMRCLDSKDMDFNKLCKTVEGRGARHAAVHEVTNLNTT